MRKHLISLAICFIFVTGCGGKTVLSQGDGGPGSGNHDGAGMGMPEFGDGGVCSPAPDATMSPSPNATQEIYQACTQHDQCKTGLCFNFNSKGPHCSAPCTEGCQCANGCSNMGVCRAP